jgi:hypothetical protein
MAMHMLDDGKISQELRRTNVIPTTETLLGSRNTHNIQWQHPTPGRLKCNVDASFSSCENKVGIDMCICDADDYFLLVKTHGFLHYV